MKVVIPAAGAGKRFREQGVSSPKELLPLGGKPLIAHALAEAARAAFESAVIVVSPSKPSLVQYLRENNHPLRIEIATQPEPLGIGDAVLRCWNGEPLAVLLPDDVVFGSRHWKNLLSVYHRTWAAALCVRPVPPATTGRFGIAVCLGDEVLELFEKPAPGATSSNLAIFGRYVVTEPVIAGLRSISGKGEIELTYGFASALNSPPGVRAIAFSGQIFDCGTPAEYASSLDRISGISAGLINTSEGQTQT